MTSPRRLATAFGKRSRTLNVQCVPVGEASAEVGSADLLVVGGPTHIRGMTTGFSRKIGISGEEKAEAKGEPTHELEPDAEAPGLREWFDDLQKIGDGKGGTASTPASSHGWLVVRPLGLPADFAGTATSSSAIRRGSSWKTHTGHFAQESLSGRNSGELSCSKRG